MKNVTLRQLNTFLEAAKSLNFARAAERLHLPPPAVTLQMKELEAAVGVILFDRRGKHFSLTTGGEYLLVYAKRVAATLREAEDALAKLQRLESGSLTVGMVSTPRVTGKRRVAVVLARGADVDAARERARRAAARLRVMLD